MLRIYMHNELIRYQSYALSVGSAKSHEYLDKSGVTFSWMSGDSMPFTLANLARVFVWDNPEWETYLMDEPCRLGIRLNDTPARSN